MHNRSREVRADEGAGMDENWRRVLAVLAGVATFLLLPPLVLGTLGVFDVARKVGAPEIMVLFVVTIVVSVLVARRVWTGGRRTGTAG